MNSGATVTCSTGLMRLHPVTSERDASHSDQPPPRLLTVQELAEILQVSVKTIYTWRYRGEGPPGVVVGRHLRFRAADVVAWLDDRTSSVPPGRAGARNSGSRSRQATEIRHRSGLRSATPGSARSTESP
jgi:excisionase family DNA binding protein